MQEIYELIQDHLLLYFQDNSETKYESFWSPGKETIFRVKYRLETKYIKEELNEDIGSFQNRLNEFSCIIETELNGQEFLLTIKKQIFNNDN